MRGAEPRSTARERQMRTERDLQVSGVNSTLRALRARAQSAAVAPAPAARVVISGEQ